MDKSQLVQGFGGLGISPPCRLMVHASLSSLGNVEGGAETVVTALREAAGPQGAVIIPSFRNAIRSDHYALRECRDACPQSLCPSRERGYTGLVGETVRQQSDSLRSCHPTLSWVGIGGDAAYLLEGHRNSPTPCGTDSPFFRLMERDGTILLLGVGVNGFTNIHAVEDTRNAPYLSSFDPANRHATYTTSGRRLQYVYPEMLGAVLRDAGVMRKGLVGKAVCHVMSARSLGSFLWAVTEDDPWCLVLRPRHDRYDPFEDACEKVLRMARVWKQNSDAEAWRLMLEASQQKRDPVLFEPDENPATNCPAYRGFVRDHHRCAASDVPPWEKFEDYPPFEPGVATCHQCNWPNRVISQTNQNV